jgi:hypothetical protein
MYYGQFNSQVDEVLHTCKIKVLKNNNSRNEIKIQI